MCQPQSLNNSVLVCSNTVQNLFLVFQSWSWFSHITTRPRSPWRQLARFSTPKAFGTRMGCFTSQAPKSYLSQQRPIRLIQPGGSQLQDVPMCNQLWDYFINTHQLSKVSVAFYAFSTQTIFPLLVLLIWRSFSARHFDHILVDLCQ